MINSWLNTAALYELWVESDGTVADAIYFSDLPWPIRRILHWKQSRDNKNLLGITKLNALEKEDEVLHWFLSYRYIFFCGSEVRRICGQIYRKAKQAYEALSLRLGDQKFFFDNRSL